MTLIIIIQKLEKVDKMDKEYNSQVFTIGHSNHSIELLLSLLQKHNINCLIDVRSVPASSYNPQFNKDSFESCLLQNNIQYMHFGMEFGARHDDENYLDETGIVDFESFRKSYQFQDGIERLERGILKGYRIALMCSEGEPLECHRFSMISVYLENINIKVKHIMKNASIKLHKELEKELLKKYEKKLPVPDLFNQNIDSNDQLKRAYKLHNKDVGWRSEANINKDF